MERRRARVRKRAESDNEDRDAAPRKAWENDETYAQYVKRTERTRGLEREKRIESDHRERTVGRQAKRQLRVERCTAPETPAHVQVAGVEEKKRKKRSAPRTDQRKKRRAEQQVAEEVSPARVRELVQLAGAEERRKARKEQDKLRRKRRRAEREAKGVVSPARVLEFVRLAKSVESEEKKAASARERELVRRVSEEKKASSARERELVRLAGSEGRAARRKKRRAEKQGLRDVSPARVRELARLAKAEEFEKKKTARKAALMRFHRADPVWRAKELLRERQRKRNRRVAKHLAALAPPHPQQHVAALAPPHPQLIEGEGPAWRMDLMGEGTAWPRGPWEMDSDPESEYERAPWERISDPEDEDDTHLWALYELSLHYNRCTTPER